MTLVEKMRSRRAVVAGSLLIAAGAAAGSTAQCDAATPPKPSRTVNVRDFGAMGDGVTDDTEAFNRATQADAEWSWDLLYAIVVPAGRYRISGTVYLRKGQSLIGEGLSTYIDASRAQQSTFVMGRRRDGHRGVEDPGGLPVRVEHFMGLGGAPSQGFIFAAIPGFQINGLFLTAVGLGIEVEGADGIISDVEIDQCLTGILLGNSQNIAISNLNIYLANYGISLRSKCRDIAISNSIFCYSKYASVLLDDKSEDMRSIILSGCIFTNNVPYKTFEGYIYSRANSCDVVATGCIFRNAPTYAINQGAGLNLSLALQSCVIDGLRTNADYNQSLASKGIRTGNGDFFVSGCTFRNLAGEVFCVGGGLVSLQVDGGRAEKVVGAMVKLDGDVRGPITIRNMQGLCGVTADGADHRVSLPWLGPATRWIVTICSRDASAPVATFQCVVSAAPGKSAAQATWHVGSSAPALSVGTRNANGRSLELRIPARQMGAMVTITDATGAA